ncbi:MAG: hypothetical protein HY908_24975 [Myxococcales bacterium]|nr:hypothetical protein [Myxococcales bacterium]
MSFKRFDRDVRLFHFDPVPGDRRRFRDEAEARQFVAELATDSIDPHALRRALPGAVFGLGRDLCELSDEQVRGFAARALAVGALSAREYLPAGGGGGLGPGPQPQPASPPSRAPTWPEPAAAIVHPLIDVLPPVVVVPRANARAVRRRVLLRADTNFDGTGLFACAADNVRFFRESAGGVPLDLAGPDGRIAGAALTSGVELWLEALAPSAAPDDVSLRLHLDGGSRPVGPDAIEPVTAVRLALDLYSDPREATGLQVLPEARQFVPGRLMPVQDLHYDNEHGAVPVIEAEPRFGHPRTKVVVHAIEPVAYAGRLELRLSGGTARLYRHATFMDQTPIPESVLAWDNADIAAPGLVLWLEGASPGGTELVLGLAGVQALCDRAAIQVLRVGFSESEHASYGYDDMAEPGGVPDPRVPHHLCVKSGGQTRLRVDVAGQMSPGDVVYTADAAIVSLEQPGVPGPVFDLPIRGSAGLTKAATLLHARLGSATGPKVASIWAHVYRERWIPAVVVRLWDETSPASALKYPKMPLPEVQAIANRILRQAVVRADLRWHQNGEPLGTIHFDGNKNGELEWPIGTQEWGELAWLQHLYALEYPVIVVVNRLDQYIALGTSAPAGTTSLSLSPPFGAIAVPLGRYAFADDEAVEIVSQDGRMVGLAAPLSALRSEGTRLYHKQAVAAVSGNLIVMDDHPSDDYRADSIAHELAHNLRLGHVVDAANLLTFPSSWGEPVYRARLRYRPVPLFDTAGLENQWETIDRNVPQPPPEPEEGERQP